MGIYWYQNPITKTAIKVTNAPVESELGITLGDDFIHIFEYPAVYDVIPVETKRVNHRQALDGALITTEPKYLYRFDITWTVCDTASVTGGVIETMKDLEFLLYLENNKHKFGKYGSAELIMQLNYDSTIGFPTVAMLEADDYGSETVFEVNLIDLLFIDSVGHEIMEARAIFETVESYDKLLYTIARNR